MVSLLLRITARTLQAETGRRVVPSCSATKYFSDSLTALSQKWGQVQSCYDAIQREIEEALALRSDS
jgi:hypothetical protein